MLKVKCKKIVFARYIYKYYGKQNKNNQTKIFFFLSFFLKFVNCVNIMTLVNIEEINTTYFINVLVRKTYVGDFQCLWKNLGILNLGIFNVYSSAYHKVLRR